MNNISTEFVANNQELRQVVNMLTSGVLGRRFDDIASSLLTNKYGVADQYMALADFDDYVRAQKAVSETYKDKNAFMKMSLTNIAKAGIFSADRSVLEYADKIWNLK